MSTKGTVQSRSPEFEIRSLGTRSTTGEDGEKVLSRHSRDRKSKVTNGESPDRHDSYQAVGEMGQSRRVELTQQTPPGPTAQLLPSSRYECAVQVSPNSIIPPLLYLTCNCAVVSPQVRESALTAWGPSPKGGDVYARICMYLTPFCCFPSVHVTSSSRQELTDRSETATKQMLTA